jgi:hypothetical protein
LFTIAVRHCIVCSKALLLAATRYEVGGSASIPCTMMSFAPVEWVTLLATLTASGLAEGSVGLRESITLPSQLACAFAAGCHSEKGRESMANANDALTHAGRADAIKISPMTRLLIACIAFINLRGKNLAETLRK